MKKALTAVTDKLILFGVTFSCWKCRGTGRHVIIRSRSNGFVTQDCEFCGHPEPLKFAQIPPLDCGRCARPFKPCYNFEGNYAYLCEGCCQIVTLGDLVPHWDELFEYDGYALESDLVKPRNVLTAKQFQALLVSIRSTRPTG